MRGSSILLLAAIVSASTTPATADRFPSIPGDCNLDWAVDTADWTVIEACILGPDVHLPDSLWCGDLNADNAADLHDLTLFQTAIDLPPVVTIQITNDADDGTEVNGVFWRPNGPWNSGNNLLGVSCDLSFDVGLRFHLPDVSPGEQFAFARLVLPATDNGHVNDRVDLRIVGGAVDSVHPFHVVPPSQLAKTEAATLWKVDTNWPDADDPLDWYPVNRHTPDITDVVNEILARPGWGSGSEGQTLAIVIEDDNGAGIDYLAFQDFDEGAGTPIGPRSAKLELYRTLRSTFVGRELLGRPTDTAVTINAVSLVALESYFEIGESPDMLVAATTSQTTAGGTPIEIVLTNLQPNRRYYYRMRYRRPNTRAFETGPTRTFHTQRTPSEPFVFTIQADSHLRAPYMPPEIERETLYRTALRNIHADQPDFHIDLGDTFKCEGYDTRDAADYDECIERHLWHRPFLDLVCHSTPFFFAIGNHEGEQGWRLEPTGRNVAVWSTNARKLIYPLPAPDAFYTGSLDDVPHCGLRENYYAWEWGGALFVVLDPYWYTLTKPHDHPHGTPGSDDNWDWTLGYEQYDWLRTTLAGSEADVKFVFSHQVTGGVDTYGRGGVEAASHALGGTGSFEWGGEDLDGMHIFDARRPGWGIPIHNLLAQHGVTIFFHGHDHLYVHQELDGVIYQECPQPDDADYTQGHIALGHYYTGTAINNAGHLRVSVDGSRVTVEYVRAYLPGDGNNGEIAQAYTINSSPPSQGGAGGGSSYSLSGISTKTEAPYPITGPLTAALIPSPPQVPGTAQ